MERPSAYRFAALVTLVILTAVTLTGSVAALEGDQVTPNLPPPPPSSSPAPDINENLEPLEREHGFGNRTKVLSDLYEHLEAAGDAETAAVIAKAIENVWTKSGSDTVDLLMERALASINEEDFKVALKLLDAVVKIAPDFAEAWHRRAMVHFLQKDYGLSMRNLRQVLALDPRHFKAIHGLGLILERLGRDNAALKAYRQVLKVYPFMDTAKQSEKELSRKVEGQGI